MQVYLIKGVPKMEWNLDISVIKATSKMSNNMFTDKKV